jgi:hypothetical protein
VSTDPTRAPGVLGPGGDKVAQGGPSVAGFTTADCFRWIYSFFSWLTSRLLYPTTNIASWVSYVSYWSWGWINANGIYTFKYGEWITSTAANLWNVRIRPVLGTLYDVAAGYRRYCLEVSDVMLGRFRDLVLGSVLSILSAVGVTQTALDLFHAGMLAARAPALRFADLLDLQLFALESRVSVASAAIVSKLNELGAWTNHTFQPAGQIRGDLLAWSLTTSLSDVLVALLDVTVDPQWQARAAAIAAAFPPSNYAATVAGFVAGAAAANSDYAALLAAFEAGQGAEPGAPA